MTFILLSPMLDTKGRSYQGHVCPVTLEFDQPGLPEIIY